LSCVAASACGAGRAAMCFGALSSHVLEYRWSGKFHTRTCPTSPRSLTILIHSHTTTAHMLTSSLCPCLCPWTSGSLRKSLHQSCCCPPFPAPCHSCLHPPHPPHRLQHRLQHHRPWRGPPCTLCTCSAHSACGITGVHGAVGKVRGRENRTQVDAGVTGRTRRSSTQTHTFHAESSKTRMSRVTCA